MAIPVDVFTIWLPIGLTVLMGLVGLLRGLGREMVVAAAIVLGALIVQQWGEIWAVGFNEVVSNASVGWSQFTIGLLVLFIVTLFVGYILGNRLVGRPNSARERLLGGVLGALTGAALAGWALRYAFVGLEGARETSPIYRDNVSQGFMIWAGWFPVALAAAGILYALLSPLRRAQAVVERPAAATDWGVSPPPGTAGETRALPATPTTRGAETVALPVSAATTSLESDVRTGSDSLGAIWDKPRPSTPIQTTTEVTTVTEGSPERGASWLGGEGMADGSVSDTPSQGHMTATTASTSAGVQDDGVSSSGGVTGGSRCANCGNDLLPGATFCTNCGTKVA